jgi:hypothetical protein
MEFLMADGNSLGTSTNTMHRKYGNTIECK